MNGSTLVRMRARGENAVHGGMEVKGKGKEMGIRTPFHPTTQQPQTQGKQSIVLTTRPARPLGDKTPFPNRVANRDLCTPATNAKLPVVSFLDTHCLREANTPDSALRPSSARKNLRLLNRAFQTPVNKGNHWEVSDTSFEEQEVQVQEVTPQPDYDEIEYAAPNTLDLPYQPPFNFELPDYKELGKAVSKYVHSYPFDDTPLPEITLNEEDIGTVTWDLPTLPELEDDDPFKQSQRNTTQNPSEGIQGKASGTSSFKRPIVGTSRPGTSAASVRPTGGRAGATASKTTTLSTQILGRPSSAASASLHKAPSALPRFRAATVGVQAPSTAIPSRPATSAAIRNRGTTTTMAVSKAAASLQRPSTSASSYKSEAALRGRGTGVTSGRKQVRARTGADAEDETTVLLVHAADVLADEFLFDV